MQCSTLCIRLGVMTILGSTVVFQGSMSKAAFTRDFGMVLYGTVPRRYG